MSLFLKKPVAELQLEAGRGILRRSLGPLNLTALGIGSIIGTGIFVLTGTAASMHAGPALVLSMIIAAIACAFAGLCYAELASMIPVAGSAYTYAYATVGEMIAWIIGWDLILEYALATSTVAVGWSGYAVSLLRDIGIMVPPELAAARGTDIVLADGSLVTGVFNLPASLIVLAVSALLVIGIRESANANTALVLIKSLVLVVFVGAGIAYISRDNLTPFIPPNTGTFGEFGWSGIIRGAGVIFFAFIGFDAVSTAAQEARNPQRDMPIGILGSLVICTLIYIAMSAVMTGIMPYQLLGTPKPVATALETYPSLLWLKTLVEIGAIAGLSSVILVMMVGQPRIFYAMSKDGLIPPMFGRIHRKYRTPHIGTIVVGVTAVILAGLLPIGTLGELVSMGTLLAFATVCIGIPILRRTRPDLPRGFRVPAAPLVGTLGAAACLYLFLQSFRENWHWMLAWIAIGFAIYFGYSRRHSKLNP